MAYPPTSKAAKRASLTSISTTSSNSSITSTTTSQTQPYPQPPALLPRRQSSVQLIPHSHTPTYFDSPLTPSEHSLITTTEQNFNNHDLSSQDFDFDDVFTFDKPHRKIPRVVEVSTPSRLSGASHHHQQQARDWSNFSFSHYGAAQQGGQRGKTHQQQGQVKLKQGMAGMQRELGLGIGAAYLRNQQVMMRGRQ